MFLQTIGGAVTDYLLDIQPELALVLQESTVSDTLTYLHTPMGIHGVENQAGDWQYHLTDGLGSVRVQVDTDPTMSATQMYDPYGQAYDVTGTFVGTFGFAGEQMDNSGLSYNRARYYNPALGAFTALDPFEGMHERPMSMNGYSYAENNPTNWTDPSGENVVLGNPLTQAIQDFGRTVQQFGGVIQATGAAILTTVAGISLTAAAKLALLAILGVAIILAIIDLGNRFLCILSGGCTVEVSKQEVYATATALDRPNTELIPGTYAPKAQTREKDDSQDIPIDRVIPQDRTRDRDDDDCLNGVDPAIAADNFMYKAIEFHEHAATYDEFKRGIANVAYTVAKDSSGNCRGMVGVSNAKGKRNFNDNTGELRARGYRLIDQINKIRIKAEMEGILPVKFTDSLISNIPGVEGHAETNLINGIAEWGQLSSVKALGITESPCKDGCTPFLRSMPQIKVSHGIRSGDQLPYSWQGNRWQ